MEFKEIVITIYSHELETKKLLELLFKPCSV